MNGLRQLVARSDEGVRPPGVVPPRTQFWSLNCSGFWHVDTNFVSFTYDLAGRRTKIKDPRGYETTFAYDAAYRLTSETNADGKVTSYAYDLMSNMTA